MNVGHWDTLNYYGDVPLISIEDFNATAVRNRAMESFLTYNLSQNKTSIPTGRFGHKEIPEFLDRQKMF